MHNTSIKSNKKKLKQLAKSLSDWELAPLVFLAARITGGHQKYGAKKRDIDWNKEMAEEAADFVNYFIWGLQDEQQQD